MADFPYPARFHLPVLSIVSREFATSGAWALPTSGANPGAATSLAWPNNNEAVYLPFRIEAPYLVQTLWWYNGATASGNVDCGIYHSDGTLIVSAGSTAQSGTSQLQKVTITGGTLLVPDTYYLGLAASATTVTIFTTAVGSTAINAFSAPLLRAVGVAQQTTAFPLANATFAVVSDWGGANGIPICGISSRAATLV